MSTETIAPGLPADWLNGWLAALGITVLVPGTRLFWTSDGVPKAVFVARDDEPLLTSIARSLPTAHTLGQLPSAGLPRSGVSFDTYQEHARTSRQTHDPSLAACLTDLATDQVEPSAFYVAGPGTVRLLIENRVIPCRERLPSEFEALAARIEETLAGVGDREKGNGLAFDVRRIASAAVSESKTVDPVVECLAFAGMFLFPVRGDGREGHTRGWTHAGTRRGAFTWPVWQVPVDRWGIDALLDRWYLGSERSSIYGVLGAYRSVPFQPEVSSDVTRGYGSERVW